MSLSDSPLGEEHRIYIQVFLFLISISQGMPPRAEPRCFTACHPLARQPRFFEIFEEDEMGSDPL